MTCTNSIFKLIRKLHGSLQRLKAPHAWLTAATLPSNSWLADPWNAVRLPIPADLTARELMGLRAAACYCMHQAYFLVQATRTGTPFPQGFVNGLDVPDAHERYEQDWIDALDRYEVLSHAYGYDDLPGDIEAPSFPE